MPDEKKPTERADQPSDRPTATAAAPTVLLSSQEYKRQQATQAMREAGERRLDYAKDGGRYLLPDGKTVVDANGKPVKGE